MRRVTAQCPSQMFVHAVDELQPTGDTTPTPVTTIRRGGSFVAAVERHLSCAVRG